MNREHKFSILYFVAAMIAVMLIRDLFFSAKHEEMIPYSTFRQLLADKKLDGLVIGETQISGSYREPENGKPEHFRTLRVDPALADDLDSGATSYSGEPAPGVFQTFLGWLGPAPGSSCCGCSCCHA